MISLVKPIIGKEEINAVIKVLKSGQLAQGPKVEELENNFAKLCETKYAVAVSSGTSALHTALHVLGIGVGDEVITTPFTFVATANSILMSGAKPVFVDIEPDTFNINPKLIERKITKKTKAILAVDLYGRPANYEEINRIAKKHNLYVIEDAAQSVGATYGNKKSGNLADIACFSLYGSKNIMSGEGGIITTNSKTFYEKARMFRHHGQDGKIAYYYHELGYNYRMTDIQAAIAIEQLKRIKKLTKRRQKIAAIYSKALLDIKGIIMPTISDKTTSAYHQYTLRITRDFKIKRDVFIQYLKKNGIQSNIIYPIPLYRFNHLSLNSHRKDFPVSEQLSGEVLSIPINPSLTDKEIYYIIHTILNYDR